MHLPRYNFSPSNKEQNMATSTSRTGLKLATNNGPRMFTHHVVKNTTTPEPNIPYITQQIKHSNDGNQLHEQLAERVKKKSIKIPKSESNVNKCCCIEM